MLTVSLLSKPPPPPSEETPVNLDVSHSTGNVNNRSKSRQQGPKETKKLVNLTHISLALIQPCSAGFIIVCEMWCVCVCRKSKTDRDGDSRTSDHSDDLVTGEKLSGLLPVDAGLWEHVSHTREAIRTSSTTEDQVTQLAK